MLSTSMLFLLMMLPGLAVLLTSFVVSMIENEPNRIQQDLVQDFAEEGMN